MNLWWSMAWRNLWRHGRRTAITAAAMSVSIGFVLGLYCFTDGTYVQMSRIMVDAAAQHRTSALTIRPGLVTA